MIAKYFEYNLFFSIFEYGLRLKHSTAEEVVSFAFRCTTNLGVGGRLFEFTKAFDTVAHKILLQYLAY